MINTPREIKYQAWIPTAEVMIDVKSITFEDDLIVAVTDRESGAVFHLHRSFLREWTGRTDVNGTDIYEKDFIKHEDSDVSRRVFPIMWLDIGSEFRGQLRGIMVPGISFNRYEVVGNIFENPELLPEEI